MAHRLQTRHLVGNRIGRIVFEVLVNRITTAAINVVDAVIHQHRGLVFIVEDEHSAPQDAKFLAPFLERVARKPPNQFIVQTQAHRSKSLVPSNNLCRVRGLVGFALC